MYKQEYDLAMKAAVKAGEFLRDNYQFHVDSQVGKDIKLSSDKKSEEIILNILKESGIPVLSEECGMVGEAGAKGWIVDPLDGTANYWKGMKELACVSIALWENGNGSAHQCSPGNPGNGKRRSGSAAAPVRWWVPEWQPVCHP